MKEAYEKLFSIIIPCYNVESFVNRVMESVIGQTVERSVYEVIAVNDASTDDTLGRLREWETGFPDTVKVITYDTNLRQGGARNIAIRQAKGEYICFLDADDWIEPDALETFKVGTDQNMDIVTALFEDNTDHVINYGNDSSDKASVAKSFFPMNTDVYISCDLGFVWSSVYRREMIMQNEVWFPEHLAYEDIYWQRLIKLYANSACIMDRVTHHHYIHQFSTMNTKNASHHIDRLTCYEKLLEDYKERGFLETYYPRILKDAIETYYFNSYYMFFNIMDEIPDVYQRIRTVIYRYFPDWETVYDDSRIPMVFQYMLKLLKRAVYASPDDLVPFRDAMLGTKYSE